VFRKNRFEELVRRQLDLFEDDEHVLLTEAAEADAAWTTATAEDSEELYGDYQLVMDAIGERLHDVRESYAAALDDGPAEAYRAEFNRAAKKRFGRYAAFLDGD
jgi:hypothetical protein